MLSLGYTKYPVQMWVAKLAVQSNSIESAFEHDEQEKPNFNFGPHTWADAICHALLPGYIFRSLWLLRASLWLFKNLKGGDYSTKIILCCNPLKNLVMFFPL